MTGQSTDPRRPLVTRTSPMNQPMPSARDAVHSYGVILHHRLAWWLVDFPQLDAMPLRARRLSGRLTPALAGWLRAATGEIGRAHVCTPVTNAHLVCRLLLEKKNIAITHTHTLR